jgi:hypothetical protein
MLTNSKEKLIEVSKNKNCDEYNIINLFVSDDIAIQLIENNCHMCTNLPKEQQARLTREIGIAAIKQGKIRMYKRCHNSIP